MLDASNKNMNENSIPGWANCLDESMSVWTNKYTCPGWMFVPRKPWPFGNEYHMVCCCLSGVLWGLELVEGKDTPRQRPPPMYQILGNTVGLLLRILSPIFRRSFVVILDSGFCVLKGIIELKKWSFCICSYQEEAILAQAYSWRRDKKSLQWKGSRLL